MQPAPAARPADISIPDPLASFDAVLAERAGKFDRPDKDNHGGLAREEFAVHFPHYEKDEQEPAAAILLGIENPIRLSGTTAPMLFELPKAIGEQRDLAMDRAKETAEPGRRLGEYLKSAGALIPATNPKYDPRNAQPFQERRGGKGGMKPDAQ